MHLFRLDTYPFANCVAPTLRVNLAAIAKSQGRMPLLCPTPFNEFANYLMSKNTSDLSSHTPMMQQYGLEQSIGRELRGLQGFTV